MAGGNNVTIAFPEGKTIELTMTEFRELWNVIEKHGADYLRSGTGEAQSAYRKLEQLVPEAVGR